MNAPALFGLLGWQEACIITALGFLIFGKRIPGVARSLGQSYVVRRGLAGDPNAREPPVKEADRS